MSFEITFCEYEIEHDGSTFIATPDVIDLLAETAPITISFPSFNLKTGSHASCGSVTQALDVTNLPSDWTITYSESEDNQISVPSFDQNTQGTFSVDFTTYIGNSWESRSLTLTFGFFSCSYATDHT